MDTYAIVTEKIINLLEQGIVPWRRPWSATGLPRNFVSKKPYRGINLFLLSATKYVSPFWLTMKQANELGGSVRKGEHSQIVVFWKVDQIPDGDSETDAEEHEADEKSRRRFVLRYYRLFNLEQCEFRKQCSISCRRSRRISTIPSKPPSGSSPECPTRPRFSGPDRRRFTARITDRITLPPRELFISAEEEMATRIS